MKKNSYSLLIVILTVISICVSSMVAQAEGLSASDLEEAQVTTLTTAVTKGFLNIANGRNCLTGNSRDVPVLATCQEYSNKKPETSVINFIEVKAGKCLTDAGDSEPFLATCDNQDKKQQWKALSAVGTEVRNVASNNCLTASGLDNPVKMVKCSGSSGQSWKLPASPH